LVSFSTRLTITRSAKGRSFMGNLLVLKQLQTQTCANYEKLVLINLRPRVVLALNTDEC